MKPKTTGTLSGCIIWILVFCVVSVCIIPPTVSIGSITSVSNFAMQTLAPLICPDGTAAEPYSYSTTTTDEYGNSQPTTAYELHCVDTHGVVVKKDPVLYAFVWIGIIGLIGLVIAAVFAFALAAPTGAWIAKLLNQRQKSNIETNIEPR